MNRIAIRIALSALTLAVMTPSLIAAPPTARSFVAGRYVLELEGQAVGFVANVEGGNVFGDVVKEELGELPYVKKHLGNAGLRDIVLEFGPGVDRPLVDWMKATLERNYVPKDGALLAVDSTNTIVSKLEFSDAQITQITFPALDAASKDPLRFTIRLTPAATQLTRPGGKFSGAKQTNQKLLLASSFRLSIEGLNMARARSIEELTVNLPPLVDPSAVCFECVFTPVPPTDFPNVIVTLPESDAGSVYKWLEDFVIKGNNDDSAEKNGTLEYMTSNFSSPVFRLTFEHLGIFEVAPVPSSSTDTIAKVAIAMYCEKMGFE